MTQPVDRPAAHHTLTLEELATLAKDTHRPAETLLNLVALIAARFKTDVCSAYLLEPDRANLVLAATVGLRKEAIGTLRLGLHEGLAGLVAEQVRPVTVAQVATHPRFKYFREAGEDSFQSFLGVPLIDRGILQGVLVVQTTDQRTFTLEEIEHLTEVGEQVAPTVSEARTLARFIAPAQEKLWALARNLWWSWDYESLGLFRDLDPHGWRLVHHNPISLLGQIPLDVLEGRARELVLHGRINYAYRRQREYLEAAHTWGATHAGILRPRPVAYFSAEFGLHESLPIYSGGLGVLAGDHIKSASDLDIPLVGVGLFYGQGYFRQWLDQHGWQHEEYIANDVTQLAMEPAIGTSGEPVTVEIQTRGAGIGAQVWEVK
jgi:starch phosphorylase